MWSFNSLFNLKLDITINNTISINNIAIHNSNEYHTNVQLKIIQIAVTTIYPIVIYLRFNGLLIYNEAAPNATKAIKPNIYPKSHIILYNMY